MIVFKQLNIQLAEGFKDSPGLCSRMSGQGGPLEAWPGLLEILAGGLAGAPGDLPGAPGVLNGLLT